jgi:DNA-binding response OmpR family regulator
MQNLPGQNSHQLYHDGHLYVDLRQQVVTLDSETITLTPVQYRVLALLVKHAGVVVNRPILLMQIWGHAEVRPNVIDGHIRRLRSKLGVYADQYIETVIGVGYRFRPMSEPLAPE